MFVWKVSTTSAGKSDCFSALKNTRGPKAKMKKRRTTREGEGGGQKSESSLGFHIGSVVRSIFRSEHPRFDFGTTFIVQHLKEGLALRLGAGIFSFSNYAVFPRGFVNINFDVEDVSAFLYWKNFFSMIFLSLVKIKKLYFTFVKINFCHNRKRINLICRRSVILIINIHILNDGESTN